MAGKQQSNQLRKAILLGMRVSISPRNMYLSNRIGCIVYQISRKKLQTAAKENGWPIYETGFYWGILVSPAGDAYFV